MPRGANPRGPRETPPPADLRLEVKSHMNVPGILLIYYSPLGAQAPTVSEHVRSFERYSQFNVFTVNTELGFPTGLPQLQFSVIVLHYSLFGRWPFQLDRRFIEYIRVATGFKVAFFQDEHQNCTARFRFIDDARINSIYSLLEPREVPKVYGRYTRVTDVRHTLTGYVSDELIDMAQRWQKPDSERHIDIGYRGRALAYFMGRGGQEKSAIAHEFLARSAGYDLILDIKTGEADRIYGEDWWRFIANCRGMLGVEAGVSIFDLEDRVQQQCRRILAERPGASFEEVSQIALREWEGNIYYRTISPRIFEAAAFGVCQILFEGNYNGILEPMKHYIPLKKDFSNFREVMSAFRDSELRSSITKQAYADLIASGVYSYAQFISQFDKHLSEVGLSAQIDGPTLRRALRIFDTGKRLRDLRAKVQTRLHRPFIGKALLKALLAPVLTRARRVNGH